MHSMRGEGDSLRKEHQMKGREAGGPVLKHQLQHMRTGLEKGQQLEKLSPLIAKKVLERKRIRIHTQTEWQRPWLETRRS